MEILNSEIDDNIIDNILHEFFNDDFDTMKPLLDTLDTIFNKEKEIDDSSHYVDNNELTELLIHYEKTRDINPKMPNRLGTIIIQICNNLSRRYNFVGYTYRDEMISDAIYSCVVAAKTYKYKPKQTSAFTYFTFIASYAMVRRIKKEKKEFEKKINLVGDVNVQTSITQEVDNAESFMNDCKDSFYSIYSDRS